MFRGADDEARAPKYAHIERERRFLVDPRLRPDLHGCPHILIEDRYIDGTRLRLRRMTDSLTGRLVFKLTKKYLAGDPLARPIVTTYLDEAEQGLLAALPANRLIKRRYPVATDQGMFGIDLFGGHLAGLEMAEFDADTPDLLAAMIPPPWAMAEVSHDAFFQGGNLAGVDQPSLQSRLRDRRD